MFSEKTLFFFLVLTLLFMICIQDNEQCEPYSFFVAGHAYGNPGVNNEGFHPPFEAKYDFIKADSLIKFGVLTGDFVKYSTQEDWEEVDVEISKLNLKIYLALGNHEYKNPELIEQRFDQTYYSFLQSNDLHIILDPNIDSWNISGSQLSWLKEILKNQDHVRNIFVYTHQLLWRSPKNKYSHIRINSQEGRDPNMNYWTEIEPLFQNLDKPIYMFAGDVGAASWSQDYSYDVDYNITYISSGMGEGEGDNFLIVSVIEDLVDIQLIAIYGQDMDALGSIVSY